MYSPGTGLQPSSFSKEEDKDLWQPPENHRHLWSQELPIASSMNRSFIILFLFFLCALICFPGPIHLPLAACCSSHQLQPLSLSTFIHEQSLTLLLCLSFLFLSSLLHQFVPAVPGYPFHCLLHNTAPATTALTVL